MPDPFVLLAALAAAQAPADAALLQPTAPAEIALAVGECWQAVGASGVDRARLAAAGWNPILDAGKPLDAPLEPLGKAGANHRIMLAPQASAKSLCSVIARASSRDEAGATLVSIQKSLSASEGSTVKAMRADDGVLFISGPRYALVDPLTGVTGTKEAPGMRIMVGYHSAEKK